MGDIADDHINRMMDAMPDAWHRSPAPRIVECRNCGKGGFHWEQTDEGWRLAGRNGLLHKCDGTLAQREALDDFDDVSGA